MLNSIQQATAIPNRQLLRILEKSITLCTGYFLIASLDPFLYERYRKRVLKLLDFHRSKIAGLAQEHRLTKQDLLKIAIERYSDSVFYASERMGRRPEVFPKPDPRLGVKLFNPRHIPKAEAIQIRSWQPRNGADIIADYTESGFHLTALRKSVTGLPMTVWALERIVSKDHCALLVGRRFKQPKTRSEIKDAVLMSIDPKPAVLSGGTLSKSEELAAAKFIALNRTLLRDHWLGEDNASSYDLIKRLKSI